MMDLSFNTVVVRWWFCLLFLILAAFLMPHSVESNSTMKEGLANTTDLLSLLAFKRQIKGDPFHVLTKWNDSLHFCQWQGIICSRRHPNRVVGMDLNGLQLVGSLSPFIANLTFLRILHLNGNKLHGQIPPEFGRLFRLRYLSLVNNSMGGEIPINLTRCWRLRTINFNSNKIVGRIPVELGSLMRLRWLTLHRNNLIGSIPTSLGNLSSLTHLALGVNGLEGNIPEELSQLRSLTYLQLTLNKLSGTIPPPLYNLSSMTQFFVSGNQLNGRLPPNLGNTLPNLIEFFVAANQFTGPIPASLSNASSLERLEFSVNQFSGSIPMNLGRLKGLNYLNLEMNLLGSGEAEDMGFLSALANCSSLKTLSVSINRLTGALPNSIANLSTSLEELFLGENQIFGSIPSQIGDLHNLILLGLSSNSMTGTIPEGIGKLNKLQRLSLHDNRFSGEIPSSIGNNTQLYKLRLHENHFQGSIPTTLQSCLRLSMLTLSQNNLSGYMPKQIFSIVPLRILAVDSNSLVGPLPIEVGKLKNIQALIVSDNKLFGEIPSSLDSCLTLESLYIQNNFFQGSFPSLDSLKSMSKLDISRNNFSGQIPEFLENLHYLEHLNLSYNDFEGEVPREGVFKNTSQISLIGNINLCGGSPALLLPTCSSKENKKQRRHFSPGAIIAIVIGSVLGLGLLLSFFYYYCARKSNQHPHPLTITNIMKEKFMDISYGDLCKATEGFSSANLIGEGSYGCVYRGFLGRIGKTVAVKVLNLQRRGASKSFIAECKALRNVRHRNLLKVLTVCSSIDSKGDDFKALVYEYMANGNLEQWLHPDTDEMHQSKNLTLTQRLNIAVDVASALNYLHTSCKKPIIHCDLKPSNVLLNDDMNAHVGDFGLARFLSEEASCSQNHTDSSGVRGTIGYVAPECGMGSGVSTFGDIYSYGILLLEIFTGKKPTDEMFNGDLSLHQFATLALPDRVMEIADQRLLSNEVEGLNERNQTHTNANAEARLEM